MNQERFALTVPVASVCTTTSVWWIPFWAAKIKWTMCARNATSPSSLTTETVKFIIARLITTTNVLLANVVFTWLMRVFVNQCKQAVFDTKEVSVPTAFQISDSKEVNVKLKAASNLTKWNAFVALLTTIWSITVARWKIVQLGRTTTAKYVPLDTILKAEDVCGEPIS